MEERAQLRKTDAPEIGDITWLNEQATQELFPLLRKGIIRFIFAGPPVSTAVRCAMRWSDRLKETEPS